MENHGWFLRIRDSYTMKHQQASETTLVEYIKSKFPKKRREIAYGIGDDAMVFRNGIVVSTDSFFDNVHFDLDYFSMRTLGYHTMAASLSDLAAMGAWPLCALVSLHLTELIHFDAVKQLYDGFASLSKKFSFDIAGGDIVASRSFGMTITVIGRAKRPFMRSSAVPGQALFVTNFLGLAEVGRMVLQESLPQKEYPDSVQRHLLPVPRIHEAKALTGYVRSCIDTSDGLSSDAKHLAEESKVPVHAEVGRYCAKMKIDPMEFILSAGEDFELLFTSHRVPKIQGAKVFKIGRVMKGRGVYLSVRGKPRRIETTGYEHLR
jgi:thiamine-monophosphate kinase